MKDLDYSISDLKKLERSAQPIKATIFYWDKTKAKTFSVERFDFDLWEVVIKKNNEFHYVSIDICEFTLEKSLRHEDIREAPRQAIK